MKTKFLKTYNFVISVMISLLETRFLKPYSSNRKNTLVIDYGTPRADFVIIKEVMLSSHTYQPTTYEGSKYRKNSVNNMNNVYKLIEKQLNPNNLNNVSTSENSMIETENESIIYADEDLNYPNHNNSFKKAEKSNYKKEVTHK